MRHTRLTCAPVEHLQQLPSRKGEAFLLRQEQAQCFIVVNGHCTTTGGGVHDTTCRHDGTSFLYRDNKKRVVRPVFCLAEPPVHNRVPIIGRLSEGSTNSLSTFTGLLKPRGIAYLSICFQREIAE